MTTQSGLSGSCVNTLLTSVCLWLMETDLSVHRERVTVSPAPSLCPVGTFLHPSDRPTYFPSFLTVPLHVVIHQVCFICRGDSSRHSLGSTAVTPIAIDGLLYYDVFIYIYICVSYSVHLV